MELCNTTKFVVIRFENYIQNGKKVVDLVPRSWVYNTEGAWFCYYPPEKHYASLPAWLASEKEADVSWQSFLITIIKGAKTLGQGKRRLEKSFEKEDISSSDAEVPKGDDKSQSDHDPLILSDRNVEDALNDVPLVADLQDSTPNDSGKRKKRKRPTAEKEIVEIQPTAAEIVPSDVQLDPSIKLVTQEDLENMYKKIKSDMKALKGSIQYDLREFNKNISNNFVAVGGTPTTIEKLRTFAQTIPKTTPQDFLNFEQELQNNEMQNTLTLWMTKYCIGAESFKDAINKILKGLITKVVQQEYSGCGRQIKGIKKNDFSQTTTYKTMSQIVNDKCAASFKQILSHTSRWLSGCSDREGGRLERMNNGL